MKKKYAREGVITHKFIEMMELLNVYLNHFPKHERHAMCANVRSTAYRLYDLCIDALRALIIRRPAMAERLPASHKTRLRLC